MTEGGDPVTGVRYEDVEIMIGDKRMEILSKVIVI